MATLSGAISRLAIASLLSVMALGMMALGMSSESFASAPPHKKVYLLRGLANVLSPGIDQLADELPKRGIDSTVANHVFSDSLADDAIEACKSGRVNTIVLVGHSLGAGAAVGMAEQLQKAGLHVALIVTLDPVVKTVAPDNVRVLKNFYLSSGVGTMVERGGHFRGMLQNVDMGSTDYGHVSLTTAPSVQKQIMTNILAANSSCR
jgi:pimeloyl-ACP methyl ester carboxylesterase